ncbi:hypothetical protein MFIFM68171_05828 [Madurella fahalii]|uniref:Zn(2)-C6 fungal-type domain-containing protein n=1 Tax=Madurella fahalii TaxID=1157608 RepID=A0ABQ0GCX0_9PEZI
MAGPAEAEHAAERPRKKVRKGTRSCWECKRRKVRCTFSGPADTRCAGCKSRGTACVSQEFPDEPASAQPAGQKPGLESRLGRVEVLVERLVEQQLTRPRNGNDGIDLVSKVSPDELPPPPIGPDNQTPPAHLIPSTPVGAVAPGAQGTRASNSAKYEDLSRKLYAAWPCQRDLDQILRAPGGTSVFLLQKIGYTNDLDSTTPRDLLRLPPSGSHPVLIAQKLLLLGNFLQGIPSEHTSVSCRRIKSQVTEAAELVTGNDEHANSIEHIECLMMQSMYQDNAGNLSRAWISIRRAMTVAQMIGLHRGGGSAMKPKTLDPEARQRIDPEQLWFRLVNADRYLSLMLGLPLGSPDNIFAAPSALEGRTPVERMRRLICLASGRILQRNSGDVYDLAETHEVDRLLQKASAAVPAQWWLMPELAAGDSDSLQGLALQDTVRLMDQLLHFHLLARLHLPYLLRSPVADGQFDPSRAHAHAHAHAYTYSKITTVNSSREVLARFVAFRHARPTGLYCAHGIDFLAFIAAATLCLAHVEAWRQHHSTSTDDDSFNGDSTLTFLAHQRPHDRAQIARAHCIIARSAAEAAAASEEEEEDVGISGSKTKMAAILRRLLLIEEDAAQGGRYRACSRPLGPSPAQDTMTTATTTTTAAAAAAAGFCIDGNGSDSGSGGRNGDEAEETVEGIDVGRVDERGTGVRIFVPHFGTISIDVENMACSSQGGLDLNLRNGATGGGGVLGEAAGDSGGGYGSDSGGAVDDVDGGFSWALQGVDMAFENLIRGVAEHEDATAAAGGQIWSVDGWMS